MRKRWCLVLALAAMVWLGGQASATAIVGNGIYNVGVMDASDGSAYGRWTAATGPAHATGGGNDLLYRALAPGSSFSSLRVYGAVAVLTYVPGATTYGGPPGCIEMDQYFTGDGPSPLAPAGQGWRTTWSIINPNFTVVQDVLAVPPPAGANTTNSAVYHTVLITNNNQGPAAIGWRNLYDWAVAAGAAWDDGPNNQLEMAGGAIVVPATTNEFSHSPVTADIARVSIDPGIPMYEPLLGLAFDPGFRPDLPVTLPDEYAYVDWANAYWNSAFDYTVNPLFDATSDSAGLSWWGRTASSAIELGPGQSVRITQVLFGVLPEEPPPGGEIPEPMTLTLCGMGLAALALRRRKRS